MADGTVDIKVSFNGVEKSLPLVVRPGLELSDLQVEHAEDTLHRLVRKAFAISSDVKFYLHEAETGRIMSVESFRDPANFPRFPPHWYLVGEDCRLSSGSLHNFPPEKHNGVADSEGTPDSHPHVMHPPPVGGVDFDEEGGGAGGGLYDTLPSLAELSPSETRYHSVTVHCDTRGEFGLSLRHFSIQPDCILRSDTPSDHAHLPRPESRSSNDSLEALKLSTTFVHSVIEGGVAEGAGLGAGLVVHMINGASILRCSPEEISQLLLQCGDELTFLMLPKDHDDLQFFYPKYTEGSPGNFSSSDGSITVCDIPVVRGAGGRRGRKISPKRAPQSLSETDYVATCSAPNSSQEREAPVLMSLPPTGLMPFSEDDPSQEEHSLPTSSEIFPATNGGRQNSTDDILIAGSLSEIENTWDSNIAHEGSMSLPLHSKSESVDSGASWRHVYPPSDRKGSAGIEFTPGELDFITEDPTTNSEWYNSREAGNDFSLAQGKATVAPNILSDNSLVHSSRDVDLEGNPRRQEQRSVDLALKHRTSSESRVHSLGTGVLASSMTELDDHTLNRQPRSKSTDLGNVRLKKKGNKSLEALTRVGINRNHSAGEGGGGGGGAELKRHRSDEHAHRIRHSTAEDAPPPLPPRNADSWLERSTNSMPSSNKRLTDTLSPPPLVGVASGDERQTSEESGSHPQGLNEVPSSSQKQRKAVRSYKSQRPKLNKNRSSSRTGSVESDTGIEPRHSGRVVRRSSAASDLGHKRRTHSPSPYLDEALESPQASLVTPVTSTPEPHPQLSPSRPDLIISEEPERQPKRQNSTGHIRQQTSEPSARHNSLDHPTSHSQSSASPSYRGNPELLLLQGKQQRQRPMSAIESFRHAGLDTTPNKAHHAVSGGTGGGVGGIQREKDRHSLTRSVEAPKKIPLYHTRSANTPYGQQIVREVNIEDAIRASQQSQPVVVSPAMRSYSNDSGVVMGGGESGEVGGGAAKKWRKKNQFGKQDFIYELATSDERLHPTHHLQRAAGSATPPIATGRVSADHLNVPASFSPQPVDDVKVLCHGVLIKKQDRNVSGKRSQDRSWKSYYAVLRETRLSFFRDRREAVLQQSCDVAPINVAGSSTEVAQNYSKKKYVFRIATAQGSEYLLQAEDVCSMQRWVSAIQQVSGAGTPADHALNRSRDSDTKLAPPPSSPVALRRFSSPQPQKIIKKKDEKGLLDRLKRWKKSREEEPDFSSYSTFGQPLGDCPMSLENKRVPLVVEFCVSHTESEGLEIEGLYRKTGQMTVTNSLSAELDKGNYELPDSSDIHTITSLLKKFFKELPDPLIPMAMYHDFVAVGEDGNEETRMSNLKELVMHLPTAHYHTFKYLMKHLSKVSQHSAENKMTPRNVSLVFGPTLMRSPTEEEQLLSMNAGYAVVEMLCTNVDYFFDADLCLEEQTLVEQASAVGGGEGDDVACRDSPLPSFRELSDHPSRGAETSQQKMKALATASPKSVRRIKNDLSSAGVSSGGGGGQGGGGMKIKQTEKRNSFIPIEGSIPLPPKLHNKSSDTLRSAHSSSSSISGHRSPDGHFLGSSLPPQNRNSVSGSTPFHQASSKRRIVRHSYEDIEMMGGGGAQVAEVKTDSVSRTRRWVNHHRDMNWGIEKDQPSESSSREPTGSMWSSKNMQQQQQSKDLKKDNRRLSKTRAPLLTSFPPPPPPQASVEKDFTTSYQEPHRQPPQRYSARASSISVATISHAPPPPPPHSTNSLSNQLSPRRRVSYAHAMGDSGVPVRGATSDTFSETERQYSRESEPHRLDSNAPSYSRKLDRGRVGGGGGGGGGGGAAFPPRMQKMERSVDYSPPKRKQDAGYTPPRHHRANATGGGFGEQHIYSSLNRGSSRSSSGSGGGRRASLKKQGSSEFREEDLRTSTPPAYSYLNRRSSAGTVSHRSTFNSSPPDRGSNTALPQQLESYL